MNLKVYTPLSFVDQSILDKIKLVYVFGYNGCNALLVTVDDEVLACGLSHDYQAFYSKPSRVDELKHKGVKGFSFGGASSASTFVIACTHSGSIYVWGKQIGVENPVTISAPKLLSLPVKISAVTCGANHCLALSVDGGVYSWGNNDKGQLGNAKITKSDCPVKVGGYLQNKFVVNISCGQCFSVVLLDNGQVCAFGENKYGQLGMACSRQFASSSSPISVPGLNDVVFKEVVCGMAHVLALTNVGEIYVWGKNDVGELGLGDRINHATPQKNTKIGRVMDIAASFLCSISAVLTDRDEVLMWGNFSGFCFAKPQLVPYKSLSEVFAFFGTPKITYKTIMVHQTEPESMSITMKNAFQNEETSDLTIKAEGKNIYVHRAILKLRSNYFRVFLQTHWVDVNQKVVKMERKYDVLYSYLRYLYTGELERVNLDFALELMSLADEFQDFVFKEKCEENLRRIIAVDTVGDLFQWALKSNSMNLLERCISFAGNHLTEVLETPTVEKWEMNTLIEFMTLCRKRKLFRS